MTNPLDRSMMFRRGFGDGAKCSAFQFPDDADYREAWTAGAAALTSYMNGIREREGFPPPNILRLQDADPWMDVPFTDAELAAIKASEASGSVEF